jgi:hypothetical protein
MALRHCAFETSVAMVKVEKKCRHFPTPKTAEKDRGNAGFFSTGQTIACPGLLSWVIYALRCHVACVWFL